MQLNHIDLLQRHLDGMTRQVVAHSPFDIKHMHEELFDLPHSRD